MLNFMSKQDWIIKDFKERDEVLKWLKSNKLFPYTWGQLFTN